MAVLDGVVCRTVAMRESEDFAFDAQRILAAVTQATRAVVICSPCNPTGRVLANDQAEILVRGLERRPGERVWLIHDEIYREQTFVAEAVNLAERYPQTIVTNSLSKSNALTGLRLGWILAPAHFIEQAIKAHAWVTSCADTFAQQVALAVFASPENVREHAAWYVDARRALLGALHSSGLRFIAPEGAFYLCVRLPDGTRSLDAANELIEDYDVLAIPGVAFGPELEGWLRLSWVAPAEHVAEGISRIARYCKVAGPSQTV
jgi:aspartate/methionine/tyrosine aminotransferase